MEKICPRCKLRPRKKTGIRIRTYCHECERELSREAGRKFREENPEYHKLYRRQYLVDNPEALRKAEIRGQTRLLILRGVLVKPERCRCGSSENIEAHHLDYDDPTHVEFLCSLCHDAEEAAKVGGP